MKRRYTRHNKVNLSNKKQQEKKKRSKQKKTYPKCFVIAKLRTIYRRMYGFI